MKCQWSTVFSAKSFMKNEHVMSLDIDYTAKAVTQDYYGKFMNHSRRPNCCIDGYNVKACCKIEVEEELTFDYSTLRIDSNFEKIHLK